MLARMRRNWITHTFLVGMGNGTATLENSLVLKKLNIHLPYNPTLALLGIYSREMKTMSTQKPVYSYTVVCSSFICYSPKLETSKTSLNW